MGRIYTVATEAVSLATTPQDLIEIIGAAGKIVKIRRVHFGATDTTLPTAQMLDLRCQFLGATVTNGTGGSSPSAKPVDPGDAAASFTAKANNSTTQASSSGTTNTLQVWGVHIYAGLDFTFPSNAQPTIGPSEAFVFSLQSTLSGTVHGTSLIEVEEIGG